MTQTYCILLTINDASRKWAKTHYFEFDNPNFGNKKRESYLLSRALLLHTLKTYFQISEIPEISYSQHQKPEFKDHSLSFNLTHSKYFVGLIISDETNTLGIDIESIIARKNPLGLLQRTFSNNEICWILNREDHISTIKQSEPQLSLHNQEMVRFFLLWSAKEAYLKADGRGLQGLNSLNLNPQQSSINGDLTNGTLLLTTLQTCDIDDPLSSLALYLPKDLLTTFNTLELSITHNHQALFKPLSISWAYQLLEDKKPPN
ncbi:4'-phosphopantetheinyl transferase superfamily protein [Ignatzschineria rhizosphaerae]|uniref:4'-phosphopantetheinyl transferase superfamily protein n=1 Tax=Ignatzschineria rhizosphaerae TaxID=2923279 RepID=A0ABY3WYG0_9GAMM|nr:4'-phosphopantetheinyl transferase superfamily protein [Ignatzschineria rhizosphaerae]UNM95652.1 4'-phosphopantetheinyl transferase superfamily protein [Ignatzschineria rhizosphaerae]